MGFENIWPYRREYKWEKAALFAILKRPGKCEPKKYM